MFKNNFSTIKEDVSLHQKCTRFGSTFHLLDHENALTYLKLRSEGCKRGSAKHFSTKTYCRADGTKDKDGPVGFRVLKVKKPLTTTPNVKPNSNLI